jgi:hypothetical protein
MHWIIQITMGWTNSHLHQFKAGETYYGEPHLDDFYEVMNERNSRLKEVLTKPKENFEYVYDFGDSWEHKIILEKVLEPEAGAPYPICTAGKRACPPEDCGGVWGFAEFLSAIADPGHEAHEEYLEWIGGNFDPEAFDVDKVNQMLRRLK